MTFRLARATLLGLTVALLLPVAEPRAAEAPDRPESVAELVDHADLAIRQDPDLSKRLAEQALLLLQDHPDADLEVRAQLVLCDHESERNQTATEALIASMEARLGAVKRLALRSGLLNCRGALQETLGNNTLARSFYEQAVSIAQSLRDDEMLAGALFSRGYLLGLQGDYAHALADLRRSETLFDKLKMPMHALTAMNSIAITYNRMGYYIDSVRVYP
jgi:tetratricopeptide (TPR) repeat protein